MPQDPAAGRDGIAPFQKGTIPSCLSWIALVSSAVAMDNPPADFRVLPALSRIVTCFFLLRSY